MAKIAGHYTCTWNGAGIGSTREGFHITTRHFHQPVIDDAFGEMQADGIQQGADVIIELDYIDYDSIATALFAQEGAEGAGNAKVGYTLTSLSHALVLTPVAGTPAATLSTPGYNFPLAIIAEDMEVLAASKLRQGRCRFRAFPNASSGVVYTKQ